VTNKLLIVTSPDYFHGNIMKTFLINPTADEKNLVQEWLKENDTEMVLYVYNNDADLTWLLNIASTSDSIYFNVDNTTDISYNYISYLIANPKVTTGANKNK
jgi:hypothetical protein